MYALKWIIQQKKKKISVAWYNEEKNRFEKKWSFQGFLRCLTMEIPKLVFVIAIYSSIPGALLRQSETSSAGKFYSSFLKKVPLRCKSKTIKKN